MARYFQRADRTVAIERVIATAPLGFRHLQIADLLSRKFEGSCSDPSPPALERLLATRVVAVFPWKGPDGDRVFDYWGRCIAVMPKAHVEVGWESKLVTGHFVDSGGLSFSVEVLSSQPTTIITGATGGYARMPPTHEVIGICDSRKGLLDLVTRKAVSAAEPGLVAQVPITGSLPRRAGMNRNATPSVLCFDRGATPATRATLIALEVCIQTQHNKDSAVG